MRSAPPVPGTVARSCHRDSLDEHGALEEKCVLLLDGVDSREDVGVSR